MWPIAQDNHRKRLPICELHCKTGMHEPVIYPVFLFILCELGRGVEKVPTCGPCSWWLLILHPGDPTGHSLGSAGAAGR